MYWKLVLEWESLLSFNSKNILLKLVEIDSESVNYLIEKFPQLRDNIFEGDFIKMELKKFFGKENFSIIGNFPHNISSQIVFKTIENRDLIPFSVECFRKKLPKEFVKTLELRHMEFSQFFVKSTTIQNIF